jgi:hypothetical protein
MSHLNLQIMSQIQNAALPFKLSPSIPTLIPRVPYKLCPQYMSQLYLKLCSSNTILYPAPTYKLCPDIPTLNLSPACNLICNIIHDCVLPINYYQAAPNHIPAMYAYYDPKPYLRKPTNNVLALSLMSQTSHL